MWLGRKSRKKAAEKARAKMKAEVTPQRSAAKAPWRRRNRDKSVAAIATPVRPSSGGKSHPRDASEIPRRQHRDRSLRTATRKEKPKTQPSGKGDPRPKPRDSTAPSFGAALPGPAQQPPVVAKPTRCRSAAESIKAKHAVKKPTPAPVAATARRQTPGSPAKQFRLTTERRGKKKKPNKANRSRGNLTFTSPKLP